MRRVAASRRWGYAAAGWSGLFAAVHLFWALGGSTGLAESAGTELAEDRPAWFTALGLYGVAALLLVAGGVGVALGRGAVLLRRRWLLPLLGAGVAGVLLLRAVVVHVVLLSDAGYGGGAVSAAQRSWTLWVWNPWFLLGGVLFGLAAVAARRAGRTPEAQNRDGSGPPAFSG